MRLIEFLGIMFFTWISYFLHDHCRRVFLLNIHRCCGLSQMRYAEGLKKAGKQVEVHFYEDGIHTFGLLNQYKLANQMLHDIETFVHS